MEATARSAREMLDEMVSIVDDYLAEGGPLTMLERGIGGPGQDRLEYNGRPQYPERLHVIALVVDITTRLLAELEGFASATARETSTWTDPTDAEFNPVTRQRLEAIRDRYSTPVDR